MSDKEKENKEDKAVSEPEPKKEKKVTFIKIDNGRNGFVRIRNKETGEIVQVPLGKLDLSKTLFTFTVKEFEDLWKD